MAQSETFADRFTTGMDGIEHFSSGSWLAECRQCPSDVDYEDGVCYDAEPYFSWARCEICGTTLGGDREDCHGVYDGGLIHLHVCSDCVYFAAYGNLPDASEKTV